MVVGFGGCVAEVLGSGVVLSGAVGVAVEVEDYRAVQEAVEHGCAVNLFTATDGDAR